MTLFLSPHSTLPLVPDHDIDASPTRALSDVSSRSPSPIHMPGTHLVMLNDLYQQYVVNTQRESAVPLVTEPSTPTPTPTPPPAAEAALATLPASLLYHLNDMYTHHIHTTHHHSHIPLASINPLSALNSAYAHHHACIQQQSHVPLVSHNILASPNHDYTQHVQSMRHESHIPLISRSPELHLNNTYFIQTQPIRHDSNHPLVSESPFTHLNQQYKHHAQHMKQESHVPLVSQSPLAHLNQAYSQHEVVMRQEQATAVPLVSSPSQLLTHLNTLYTQHVTTVRLESPIPIISHSPLVHLNTVYNQHVTSTQQASHVPLVAASPFAKLNTQYTQLQQHLTHESNVPLISSSNTPTSTSMKPVEAVKTTPSTCDRKIPLTSAVAPTPVTFPSSCPTSTLLSYSCWLACRVRAFTQRLRRPSPYVATPHVTPTTTAQDSDGEEEINTIVTTTPPDKPYCVQCC